jgi:alkylhydroperoxidase family enzyme
MSRRSAPSHFEPRIKSPALTLPGTREARHYSEAALGALVMSIALANLWNRLNVATRQVTGDWIAQYL